MAIYNVEYVDESTAKKNDDLLDNMLEACDTMMAVLDEHGGARMKYVNMKYKEANDARDKYYDYIKKADTAKSDKEKDEYYDKAEKYNEKAYKAGGEVSKYSSGKPALIHRPKSDWGIKCNKEWKDQFMQDFGGPSTGSKVHSKPGEIKAMQDAKKKAIKETCLSILSIIDEL